MRSLKDKLWLCSSNFPQEGSLIKCSQVLNFTAWLGINVLLMKAHLVFQTVHSRVCVWPAEEVICTVTSLCCEIRCPCVSADLKLTLLWPTFHVHPHPALTLCLLPPLKHIKMTPVSSSPGKSLSCQTRSNYKLPSSFTAFHTFIHQLSYCMATFSHTFH